MNIDYSRLTPAEIGDRLRRAREHAQVTQASAAAAIEVARTTLVAIEQGSRKPRIAELQKLAYLYGTSVNALFRNEAVQVDLVPRFRRDHDADSEVSEAAALLNNLVRAEAELENLLGVRRHRNDPPERPVLPGDVHAQAERDAQDLRQWLGLGSGPVQDIVSLLELELHLFYVGRDDVHGILKHVLSRVSVSLYLNMFGFDDDELNEILKKIAVDPTITMLVTLDKSQAGGKHEKALLDADRKASLALFNTHVAIGQSLTHQISHTKGFVADGKVAGEGSTNWSVSGEGAAVGGTFNTKAAGFKAQNNTQSIITDPDTISRFTAELVAEHMIAQQQASNAKTVEAVKAAKAAKK